VRPRRYSTAGCDTTEVYEASMEPRTCVLGDKKRRRRGFLAETLQWSRGRASSEISRCARTRSCRVSCFNGAEDVRPRRCAGITTAGSPYLLASMEPRTCVLGDWRSWCGRARPPRCFNGAEDVRPRRCDGLTEPILYLREASMEPRTCVLGDLIPRPIVAGWSSSFNGAEDVRPRRW